VQADGLEGGEEGACAVGGEFARESAHLDVGDAEGGERRPHLGGVEVRVAQQAPQPVLVAPRLPRPSRSLGAAGDGTLYPMAAEFDPMAAKIPWKRLATDTAMLPVLENRGMMKRGMLALCPW
jgi:hypothetical protein